MATQVASPMAVRAHEEMFAYWASRKSQGRLPARGDIDPSGFKRHLPTVSLIDVRENPMDFRVRLAGTGLYNLYSREITGLGLDDVYAGDDADYWRNALERVVRQRKPSVGLRPMLTKEGAPVSVMWLRLPLAADGERVNMILGYDAVIGAPSQISGIRAA